MWAAVSGVNVEPDQVESLLTEVRKRVPAEKDPVWWIGPSARPVDLYEQLEAFGLRRPHDRMALMQALALAREPEGPEGSS